MLILTHTLYRRTGEAEKAFDVRIYQPVKEDRSWRCRYEIDWPDEEMHVMRAGGYDALQALVLAMGMISAEIYTTDYHAEGRLRVYETEQGYGFPVIGLIRELAVGADTFFLSS
jgi:hypothetical protein